MHRLSATVPNHVRRKPNSGIPFCQVNRLTCDLNKDYIQVMIRGRFEMKFSEQIKPISYLKAHAAEIVRELQEKREPLVITQNGEAKVVIQDVASYEEVQETLALLKILALGNREIEEGREMPIEAAFSRVLTQRKKA